MANIKMGFRWFNTADKISLSSISQIPQVNQIVTALNLAPGAIWPKNDLEALKQSIEAAGFDFQVVESLNVHDDIKAGLPTRDRYIENYIKSLRHLAAVGVRVICYNFMPVFDWVRTSLNAPTNDRSLVLAFRQADLPANPATLSKAIAAQANDFTLPGWEPERLAELDAVMEKYRGITEAKLRANLAYFLDAVIPVCEELNVTMAMHPDDPPMSVFGLPRIYKNLTDMRAIEDLNPSLKNAFTLCTGSLGENPDNDVPTVIREFTTKGKVPFVHLRNIQLLTPTGDFQESAHESSTGSLDMFAVMTALFESGFDGYARPDHGRSIWGETSQPGYGLYDRALGISYLNGLWEAIEKNAQSF